VTAHIAAAPAGVADFFAKRNKCPDCQPPAQGDHERKIPCLPDLASTEQVPVFREMK